MQVPMKPFIASKDQDVQAVPNRSTLEHPDTCETTIFAAENTEGDIL